MSSAIDVLGVRLALDSSANKGAEGVRHA